MPKTLTRLAAPLFALALLPMVAVAEEPGAETVIATVNGTDITLGHMILVREGLPQQYAQLPNEVLFKGILDQLINQTLLEQSMKGHDSKRVLLAMDNQHRSLMSAEAIEKLIDEGMTEAALKKTYEETYAGAEPEKEFNASHILVETEDEAKALITELNEGADFAALAKAKSTGPSGPSGGELGWFGTGMMVAPFEEAVAAMNDGDISAPVKTQFGWHVIKLNESRLTKVPPLEEVRDDIELKLQTRLVEDEIARLKEDAKIDRTAEIEFNPELIGQSDLLEN
ncbi:peptidylprolyl isomerase [Rhodalgimonas zhirmunskyi]|uniref:Parvulin-like PPIase n=1 Tax=Rhodalgimonas zhirmunskyi TaxID=2964767 RepID=A0AAJ1UD53_9RHOB|nr:peptidylprolyl isomerase [Rhodoalgimonas zhirmunskyi]MDQ2094256.1 peptidylprolyl isomerase [Rhodoalgimonas zhirmunskyi]